MLIQHDKYGKIIHLCSEPNDAAALAELMKQPNTLHFPPTPLPEVPGVDEENNMIIDPETGKIVMASPGSIECDANIFTHMIVDGQLALRPVIAPLIKKEIRSDGKDFIPIFGLPDPVTVYVDGQAYEITGGRLDFTADQPGTYKVSIGWPCQDWFEEIVAK